MLLKEIKIHFMSIGKIFLRDISTVSVKSICSNLKGNQNQMPFVSETRFNNILLVERTKKLQYF